MLLAMTLHIGTYCVSAWMCRSFARSLSLLDNRMLRQHPGQSLNKYFHFMRQTFDDYNETCEVIDGSTAIDPYHVGLLMFRGISSTGPYGHAKMCVITAFDTNYLMSADEVMASILHVPQNMDEELHNSAITAPTSRAPPVSAFVVAGRGSHCGRGHSNRGGMPNKLPRMWQSKLHSVVVHNLGRRTTKVNLRQPQDNHPKVWHPWRHNPRGRCPHDRRHN
jgi:hypothetical protein